MIRVSCLLLALMASNVAVAEIPDYIAKVQVIDGRFTDTGTGVYMDANTVLTAGHNLRDLTLRNKLVVDGVPAKVIYKKLADAWDIAVLKVEGSGKLAAYPRVGTNSLGNLRAQGYAKGHTYTEVAGPYVKPMIGFFHMKGTVIQGMSGGPVINEAGELVGIVTGTAGEEFIYRRGKKVTFAAAPDESVLADLGQIKAALEGGGVLQQPFLLRLR